MRTRSQSSDDKPKAPDWSQLLVDAVNKPGIISAAYSKFWSYSVGNQLLAWFACAARKIPIGPIHTFQGWKELGRHVKRGERAITLCMPVIVKCKRQDGKLELNEVRTGDGAERQITGLDGKAKPSTRTVFVYKPHWFVLAQTEGQEYQPTDLPTWTEQTALSRLSIERTAFKHPDGNVQGYALERTVAVSPIAAMPYKTLFHELAHIVLGHTEALAKLDDHEQTPMNLREVEAECVALICCESLGLDGAEFSRGYIQHWLGKEAIPERSAQKIFKAADTILKAGHPKNEKSHPGDSPEKGESYV